MFAGGHAFAEQVTVNGIVYDVVKKGKVATLIGVKSCTGDVIIPEYITFEGVECLVNEISRLAFSGSSLHSVTIPNTITKIGDRAFSGCISLVRVNLPEELKTIESNLFEYCTSLCDVKLPEGLTTIEYSAFWGCTSLFGIELPKSLLTIKGGVFEGCTSLKSISIPEGVTSIDERLLCGCTALTSVYLPKSLTNVGNRAIERCEHLEDIYCYADNPPTVSTWSTGAFYGSYIEYATLHVPAGSIDAYKSADQWKDFGSIVTLTEEGQCAKPEISYENGKLEFSSSTNGAQFFYTIVDEDVVADKVSCGSINLNATLNISVYAEANGYTRSETATATLCWIDGTLNTSGIEAARVEKRPVIVSANGNSINVKGVSAGERVTVYSVNGMQLGSAIADGDEVNVNAHSLEGNIAIIKIGEESIKVRVAL